MEPNVPEREASERQWTAREIRDLCHALKSAILRRNLASEDEVRAVMPTAEDSYNKHVHGYAMMQALRAREQFLAHGSEYASKKLMAALSDEPVEVELTDTTKVSVYPKSEAGLRVLGAQYDVLNWVNDRAAELLRQCNDYEKDQAEGLKPLDGIKSPFELLEEAAVEQGYRTGLIMWIACTPGVRLPWPYGAPVPLRAEVPARWMDLHPLDVQRIESAIAEANAARLRFLPKPKERGRGVTVDQFFAQTAKATGHPVRHLRENVSLLSLLAQVVLAGYRDEAA